MHKKLALAVAVAGVLAAPQTFAAATIYGLFDIGVQRVDPGTGYAGNKIFVNDTQGAGGSLIGFSASEDLGGGMKAIVTLETGFNSDAGTFDNATNQVFQRQAFGGLAGGFGTITGGRQYKEIFLVGNSSAYNYTSANIGTFFLNPNMGVRQDNFIKYASPKLGGVTLVVGYAPGEGTTAAAKDNGKFVEFAAKWSSGPLSLGAAAGTATVDTTGTPVDTKTTIAGGQYSFGPWTVYALYAKVKNDSSASALNRTGTSLGGKFTVGSGDVVATIGKTASDVSGATSADSKLIAAAYFHRLSKTTTAYVSYGTLANDANAQQSLARQAVTTTAVGEDPNALSFGVKVAF